MGCADVCLSHDYDGDTSLYREGFSHARKEYGCCECGDAIPAGEQYQWASGKTGDGMFRVHTCAACAEIRAAFFCGSWIFGEMWETIREGMFPVWKRASAIDCLAKLTTDAAIAKCNAEYAEWRDPWEAAP
jgi:hypothetical protein